MQEQAPSAHLIGKKSKVDRYDWKIIDRPGHLRMLNKNLLRVDDSYQRDETSTKVLELARAWSWMACGALLVAERDGVYFVFDGQHRAMAALRRSDIETLPCVVFRTEGSQEEAEAFLRANKNRKSLNGLAKFRAAVTAGHADALLVEKLIHSIGRVPADTASGNSVRCLSLMMDHASRQPQLLAHIWPLIAEVCNGKPVHERVLDSFMYIENNLPAGQSLMDKEWRRRAVRAKYDGLLGAANRFAAAYSRGGAKIWAKGMVEAMNKGCKLRMTLIGADEE